MVLGNGSNGKPKWIHSAESLRNGKVTYTVKFVGKAEVSEPRGMPMVKAALQKLTFSRQIKRTEGAKPPKVELGISIHSVSISDLKTKAILHNIALHRVSFCADDKEDKRLFAFIAKLDDNKHYCYGLDSLHQANDITLTIGQAFELAYQKFMKEKPPSTNVKKTTDMSKRIQDLESENSELRRRIAELEATQRRIQSGNGEISLQTPILKPPPSTNFSGRDISVPRHTSLTSASVLNPQQEAIVSLSGFIFNSDLTQVSLASSPLITSRTENNSYLIPSNTRSGEYASIDRSNGTTPKNAEQNSTCVAEGETAASVGNSVKKFRNTLQKNMRRTMASEEKMKKTLSSLFPAKIISKKLKKGKPAEPERKFTLLDNSPGSSCSSAGSSSYANLDDVIATLQKMMDKGDMAHKKWDRNQEVMQSENFIGEKLATYHDTEQSNYDTIPRRMVKKLTDGNHLNGCDYSQSSIKSKGMHVQHESNDDLSSLSTTTTDSSSKECVYILQPFSDSKSMNTVLSSNSPQSLGDSTKQNFSQKSFHETRSSSKSKKQNQNPQNFSSTTNIDTTLHHLGGEDGYMVLSGRKQVQDILTKAQQAKLGHPTQDLCVDTTYDNVSRLMEAVRDAAARDAANKGEDVKKILVTPASVAPLMQQPIKASPSNISKRPYSLPQALKARSTPHQIDSAIPRPPSILSMSTDYSTVSLSSYGDTVYSTPRNSSVPNSVSLSEYFAGNKHSSTLSMQPQHLLGSSKPFIYGLGMQNSQETDILHSQDHMHPSSSKLTSEDAFNMQPFVPTATAGRLPQPPSRQQTKPQGNLWSEDPFQPFQNLERTNKELIDMQSLSEASTSDTPSRGKKSNYHKVSHPLIRKKQRSKRSSALKWSKKHVENGRKKSSRCKKSATTATTLNEAALNNAFSRGLVLSDENLTLDSFDPLKG